MTERAERQTALDLTAGTGPHTGPRTGADTGAGAVRAALPGRSGWPGSR